MRDVDSHWNIGPELSGYRNSAFPPFNREYTGEQSSVLGEIFGEAASRSACENPGADRNLPRPDAVVAGFGFDSSVVSKSEKDKLIHIARAILAGVKGPVLLMGHTDPVGAHEYNCRLGRRRAEEVRRLINLAIEAVRRGASRAVSYQIQSRGEARPVMPNDSEKNRSSNRRVEVFLPSATHGTLPAEPVPKGAPLTVQSTRPTFVGKSWTPIEKSFGRQISWTRRRDLYLMNNPNLDNYAADFAPKARTREEYYFYPGEATSLISISSVPYADPYANIRKKKPELYKGAVTAEEELRKFRWFKEDYEKLSLAAGSAKLGFNGQTLYVEPEQRSAESLLGKMAEEVVKTVRDLAIGALTRSEYPALILNALLFLKDLYSARGAQDLVMKQDRERYDEAYRIKLRFFIRLKTPRGADPVVWPSRFEETYWKYRKVYYEQQRYRIIEEKLRMGLDPDDPNQRLPQVMRPA
jgi:outer membrane protein OmpA-like peptidoglycan-associated protein